MKKTDDTRLLVFRTCGTGLRNDYKRAQPMAMPTARGQKSRRGVKTAREAWNRDGSPLTCIAGRIVAAVVWMAPLTMPSASPVATIITPNVLTSPLICGAVRV